MGQTLGLELRGQRNNVSPLITGRNGNVLLAENCVVNRQSYIEGRRGWTFYGTTLPLTTGQTINRLIPYKSRLLNQYKDKLAYDSDGNGTWTDYSYTHTPITGYT